MSSTLETKIIRSSQGRKMSSAQVRNFDLSAEISGALQRWVGHYKKPPAVIASRVGRSMHAAKKWLAGENAPGFAEGIELARESDEVWEVVCKLANRTPATVTQAQYDAAIEALRILTERH